MPPRSLVTEPEPPRSTAPALKGPVSRHVGVRWWRAVVVLLGFVVAAGLPALALRPWSVPSRFEPASRLLDRPLVDDAMLARLVVSDDPRVGLAVVAAAVGVAAAIAWVLAFVLLTSRRGRAAVRLPIGVAIIAVAALGIPRLPEVAVDRYYEAVRTDEESDYCTIWRDPNLPIAPPVAACDLPWDSPTIDGSPPTAAHLMIYDLAADGPVLRAEGAIPLSGTGTSGASSYWAGVDLNVLGNRIVLVDSGGIHAVDATTGVPLWSHAVSSPNYETYSSGGPSRADDLGYWSEITSRAVAGIDPARIVAYVFCGEQVRVFDIEDGRTLVNTGCP